MSNIATHGSKRCDLRDSDDTADDAKTAVQTCSREQINETHPYSIITATGHMLRYGYRSPYGEAILG